MASFTPDEVLLANTFLNMYTQTNVKQPTKRTRGQRLQWNDRVNTHRSSAGFKNRLCTLFLTSYEQLPFNKPIPQDVSQLKSILKGSETKVLRQNLVETQIPQQPRASS